MFTHEEKWIKREKHISLTFSVSSACSTFEPCEWYCNHNGSCFSEQPTTFTTKCFVNILSVWCINKDVKTTSRNCTTFVWLSFTKGTSKSFSTNCWTRFFTNRVTLKTELTTDRQAIPGLEQTANAPPLLDHKPDLFVKKWERICKVYGSSRGRSTDPGMEQREREREWAGRWLAGDFLLYRFQLAG